MRLRARRRCLNAGADRLGSLDFAATIWFAEHVPSEPVVLGVDSSTQSVKVEARRLESGEVVATAVASHPPTTPPVSEQDPVAWWDALVSAVGQLGMLRRDVAAMSVAGQQHGLVLLDEHDAPVRLAKLWNDTTSAPQSERLIDRFGAADWARRVGSIPVPSFTITKLAWVAEHEPAALAAATRVALPHDYLTLRLTGRHVTDRGDASGTGWYDASTDRVDLGLLDAVLPGVGATAGAGAPRLPTVLGPTDSVGRLTSAAADELGLPAEVEVAVGSGDNMGAALGLGLRPGDVAISLGTSGTAFAVSETATHDASGAVAGFADATGRFLPLVCTLNATKVTDTVAGWLGCDLDELARLALSARPDPGEVSLLPYFDGERTPNLPDATGELVGLRNSTTRAQLALAAYDGVLRGLFAGVDALRDAGVVLDGRVFLIGGGARSAAFRYRAADLLGRDVVVPDADHAVATGAAAQAAVVAGAAGFDEVAERWGLGGGSVVIPNSGG
ncbi:MAG: xylulokinase [Actinomycetota bacterium]